MNARVQMSRGAVSRSEPNAGCSDGDRAPITGHHLVPVKPEIPDRNLPSGSRQIPDRDTRSPRRRIALFTENYLHVTDGVARTLGRLVHYLKGVGHHVLVFGPGDRQIAIPTGGHYIGVPSLPMPGRPEYRLALGLSREARRRLRAFSPDLVHIATPDLMGIAALLWARAHGIPVVATYHTHFPAYLHYYNLNALSAAVERYMRWFYFRCPTVCVPTAPLASYFETLGMTENVRIWGRGVDMNEFHPQWRSQAWRIERGLAPDDVLVTFVGRLVREKSLDVFASVVERLRDTRVCSMVVGDGPLRAELSDRLPETVITGYLEGRELSRAYASSDVFLFPSDSEAFGNVIVEAMASGLAVVCAGSSGSSEHIVDGESGLTAAPNDIDGFLAQTRRLIADPDKRIRFGMRARARALKHDWNETLALMGRIYEEALEEGGMSAFS